MAHPADLTPTEQAFLEASEERAERELRTERARAAAEARSRRRLRVLLTAAVAAAVVAIGATVVAVRQRDVATTEARRAIARQLGSSALVPRPLDEALLLAVSAVRLDDNAYTRSALLAALQRAPAVQRVWQGDGQPLSDVVLTRGDTVATAAEPTRVVARNLATGTATLGPALVDKKSVLLARRPGTDDLAVGVPFNSYSGDRRSSYVKLVHGPGARQTTFDDLGGVTDGVTSIAWSSDGRWLAATQLNDVPLIWDALHSSDPRKITSGSRRPAFAASSTLPSGKAAFAVVERSGRGRVYRADTLRAVLTFAVEPDVTAVVADPAGSTLAVAHGDGTVDVIAASTGRRLHTLTRHVGSVRGLAFSQDGSVLASMGDDQTVELTDVVTGGLMARLLGHTEPVLSGAFSADGRRLYTTSANGDMIAWDIAGLNNLGDRLSAPGSTGAVSGLTWVAAGRAGQLAVGYGDGTARIWPAQANSGPLELSVSGSRLTDGAFSADGRLLAVTAQDGTIRFVHPGTGHVEPLAYHTSGAAVVAFSPDGHLLAIQDRTEAHFLDVAARRQAREPLITVWRGVDIAWSPDSRYIAVTDDLSQEEGAVATVYDTRVRTDAARWRTPARSALAWSPDGRIVAVVGEGDTGIQLLSASDGTLIRGGWRDYARTTSLAFSPDGSLLASGGDDGTVVLRDFATGTQYGPPLTASPTSRCWSPSTAPGGWWSPAPTVASGDGTSVCKVCSIARVRSPAATSRTPSGTTCKPDSLTSARAHSAPGLSQHYFGRRGWGTDESAARLRISARRPRSCPVPIHLKEFE